MPIISIPSNTEYSNLNTLSGYPVGSEFILTNNTSSPLFIISSSVQPSPESFEYPVKSGQTVIIEGGANPYWIKGNTGPVVIQDATSSVSPYSIIDLPDYMYTSSEQGFRRMRVDVGQTGFFEAREFRMVRKVSITAGTPLVFKFVSAVDFILFEQSLNCSVGDIEYYAWRSTQGTEGGTFTPIPVQSIAKNISATYRDYNGDRYQSQVSISSGGTFTPTDPLLYVDYDRAKTSGATAQRSSVSGGDDTVRFLAAGTYYLILTSLDGTSVGRFAIAWEERP